MSIFSANRSFRNLGGVFSMLTILIMFSLAFVGVVQGAEIPGLTGPIVTCGASAPGCNFCNLVQLSQNIINFLVGFSVIVAVLLFVYAGFLYLTAGASEENVKTAHKVFRSVFIGFIIVLAAWLIIDTIMKAFVKTGALFGPWNTLGC